MPFIYCSTFQFLTHMEGAGRGPLLTWRGAVGVGSGRGWGRCMGWWPQELWLGGLGSSPASSLHSWGPGAAFSCFLICEGG